MKAIVTIFISLLTGNLLLAQSKFIKSGSIEYEKTVNVFAIGRTMISMYPQQVQSMLSQSFDMYQKRGQQFSTATSTLTFDNNTTLFKPVDPTGKNKMVYLNLTLSKQLNTVYTDLNANKRIVQKDVLGTQFLLTDSLSKIKWKLTDETQDIAGYTCRRANGLILDSVYVVAFYTDKIRVSGGPESFSGLPGMILELAIPHEHVTWLAKKIDPDAPASQIAPPQKGKPVNNKQLFDILNNALKPRGQLGLYEVKVNML